VPLVQKLYRLVFLALGLADGEAMLVPSLVGLLKKCLEAATKQRNPQVGFGTFEPLNILHMCVAYL
jgi:hypothetical protein